jgi:putative membrane protein
LLLAESALSRTLTRVYSAPLAVSTETSAAIQVVVLAILAALYARRTHTLARSRDPVPPRRQVCFYGGLVLAAVALAALGPTGRHLLWVDMIETILLGDLAALLIVLGLTEPLLAPLLRVPVLSRLPSLSHPVVAFALWAIDLYAWHVRVFCEAALHHSSVQVLEHAMFLAFGVNMWMCLFGPLPKPTWFDARGKLTYVLAVRLTGAALANIFLWSGTVFYPYYLTGEARFHISPIADQNIAGAIMLGEAAILTVGLLYWLLEHTIHEGVRHTGQFAFAHSRGRDRSDDGSRRSARTGSGAGEAHEPMQARSGASESR